jgi:hypothetical protein
MTVDDFRRHCDWLVHFAPTGFFCLDYGLLTAAQLLDTNANQNGQVFMRFAAEPNFSPYDKEHWKCRPRFKRKAGELGSNMFLRDKTDPAKSYFLGNNYPLGDGSCIGTTLPLTNNLPGTKEPSREDWFRILNSMFWVFDSNNINQGLLSHLTGASPDRQITRVAVSTKALPDDLLNERVRLSSINGGGANGAFPRGTATYKRLSEWSGSWPPKEIGIWDGIPKEVCAQMLSSRGMVVKSCKP